MTYLDERTTWERSYWARVLARCKGNITRVARESGCHRQSIYKILKRLEVRREPKPRRGGNAVWHALEDR